MKNTHIVLTVVGVAIGVLTLLQTYLHTGMLPSNTELAGVFAGTGISLTSIIAGIFAHLQITVPTPALPPAATLAPSPAPSAPIDVKALAAAVKQELLNPS